MTGDGFRCLPVPNFLLTGFFGPEHNPERSDFENACFGGNADAASRLRMSVRPAASLHFELHAEQKTGIGGKLDLGFLGPWAPELSGSVESGTQVSIDVALDDAEIRVLSSVAEILGQQYGDTDEGSPVQQSLESCIASICAEGDSDGQLLYTAKVLAAAPVIRVESHEKKAKSFALAAGVTRFALDDKSSKDGVLVLRAKEKLNVAALLEAARPAFERAKTCEKVTRARARRRVLTGLREIGLGTLAGRALADVPGRAGELRKDVTNGAFSDNERTALIETLDAIEGAARQLSKPKPNAQLCATRGTVETVLSSSGDGSSVHALIADLMQPLHRRLTDMANDSSLPCAEPLWYRDLDRDGYGDRRAAVRAAAQPPGYVANGLDCYDQNPEVYPGQRNYFAQHRGDQSFDYDCDGRSTKQDDVVSEGCRAVTTLGIPTKCWADVGWQGKAPDCGGQGKWLAACEASTLSCSPTNEPRRVQECR